MNTTEAFMTCDDALGYVAGKTVLLDLDEDEREKRAVMHFQACDSCQLRFESPQLGSGTLSEEPRAASPRSSSDRAYVEDVRGHLEDKSSLMAGLLAEALEWRPAVEFLESSRLRLQPNPWIERLIEVVQKLRLPSPRWYTPLSGAVAADGQGSMEAERLLLGWMSDERPMGVLVQGGPGAGKSSLLGRALKQWAAREPAYAGLVLVPVLNAMVEWVPGVVSSSPEALGNEILKTLLGPDTPEDLLQQLMASHRVVFLFDGFAPLRRAGVQNRAGLIKSSLSGLVALGVTAVAACRESGEDLAFTAPFRRLWLLPLSAAERSRIASLAGVDPDRLRRVHSWLAATPEGTDISGSPYWFELVASVAARGSFQPAGWEPYRYLLDHLLSTHSLWSAGDVSKLWAAVEHLAFLDGPGREGAIFLVDFLSRLTDRGGDQSLLWALCRNLRSSMDTERLAVQFLDQVLWAKQNRRTSLLEPIAWHLLGSHYLFSRRKPDEEILQKAADRFAHHLSCLDDPAPDEAILIASVGSAREIALILDARCYPAEKGAHVQTYLEKLEANPVASAMLAGIIVHYYGTAEKAFQRIVCHLEDPMYRQMRSLDLLELLLIVHRLGRAASGRLFLSARPGAIDVIVRACSQHFVDARLGVKLLGELCRSLQYVPNHTSVPS